MSQNKGFKIGSKWRFKHSNRLLFVKIFAIEFWYIEGKRYKVIIYGLPNAKSGHISQSVSGFLKNYDKEKL